MPDFSRVLLHLAEGLLAPRTAKTTRGLLQFSRHQHCAVVDSANVGKSAQDLLGTGGAVPVVATVGQALDRRPRPEALVIGATNPGGVLPSTFRPAILDAIDAGLEVWNGLHDALCEDREFAALAAARGVRLWDVRRHAGPLPVGRGAMLDCPVPVVLTVGGDGAVGKMSAALALCGELERRGLRPAFIPTGQTGIMIAGWGHCIDAVAGDFMSGCVEADCLDAVARGADIVVVEGQGSLFHPGFSPVTLALLHGAFPDVLVVCHEVGRERVSHREHLAVPSLAETFEAHAGALAPYGRCPVLGGVCLNTWPLGEAQARQAVETAARDCGVAAADPLRFGPGDVATAVLGAAGM